MKPLILAGLMLLASCSKSGPPDLEISDAWARETVAGQTSTAGYMTIANKGSGDDLLLSVAANAPTQASLHSTTTANGVSGMRPLPAGLAIPAGATVELKPGGTHVMLTGLQAPLRSGETLKLTLRFEKGGERRIDVRVSPASGERHH